MIKFLIVWLLLPIKIVASGYHYVYTYTGKIEEKPMQILIDRVNSLKPNEQFILYIDSPGGYIVPAEKLIKAFRQHSKQITCIVNNEAGSAAAMIAINCGKLIMSKNATLMFHTTSTTKTFLGLISMGEIKCSLKNYKRHKDLCQYGIDFMNDNLPQLKKFLTKQEILDTYNGKDIWLNGYELKTRNPAIQLLD